MKHYTIRVIAVLSVWALFPWEPFVFSQTWEWARQAPRSDGGLFLLDNSGYGLASDDAGNVYVTGVFEGTIRFGPHTLTSGSQFGGLLPKNAAFVAKYDNQGRIQWASKLPGEWGVSVAVDQFGNVFTAGSLLTKLSNDGTQLWSLAHGGNLAGVTVDGAGSMYVLTVSGVVTKYDAEKR